VNVAPNAACVLHPQGVADADHLMHLFANSEGELRFHVNARQESAQSAQMQIDCTSADGKSTTFPLELSASASAPKLSSKSRVATLPQGATLQPGLSEDEARSLSDRELAQRHYPPRPDSATSSSAYSTWLGIVSQPAVLVRAGVVTRADISHDHGQVTAGSGSFANWSGYELSAAKGTYDAIQGEWYVPSVANVTAAGLGLQTYSAYWIGLDGIGTSDLVQAGTEQQYFEFPPFSFSNYYAFSELLPNQPTESVITGITVSPSNHIFTSVWIGDVYGDQEVNGGYGWFFMLNETTGQMAEFETPLGSTSFTGSEANWIMERPWVNGAISILADYDEAIMFSAEAGTTAGPWVPYLASNTTNWTMVNDYVTYDDNNTLSTVQEEGSNTEMLFVWHNYH
jgi:hypothetical protein